MECNLNRVLGYSPDCDRDQCVYWRNTSGADCSDPGGCVLDRFGLIGKHPDALAHWLMHHKLQHRVFCVRKMLEVQRERKLILR